MGFLVLLVMIGFIPGPPATAVIIRVPLTEGHQQTRETDSHKVTGYANVDQDENGDITNMKDDHDSDFEEMSKNNPAPHDPVLVELYYETLCPSCRKFISNVLFPTFQKLKKSHIMDVALYPYGNAHEKKLPDGSWKFDCQHGHTECIGNLVQVCILKYLDWEPAAYLPVISCMEAAQTEKAIWDCIKELSELDFDILKNCAKAANNNRCRHQVWTATFWNHRREKRDTSVTGGISITVNLEQLRRRWMENWRQKQNEDGNQNNQREHNQNLLNEVG